MADNATRYMDNQGRIILPAHMRKKLNLTSGKVVEIILDGDAIRIRPTEERCSLCGESVEGKHFTEITAGPSKKRVCYNCAQMLAHQMMK